MSQLTVEIVARTAQVMRQLGATEQQIEAVNAALRDTSPAAAQSTAGLNQTAAAATQTAAASKQAAAGLNQAATAAQQSAAGLNQAATAASRAAAASNKLGNSKGLNNQVWFQAGQAISDFSIAGVRGAANNLEFLALQLGAGAPLLIGLSLASAAFFTFGDEITAALDPVGTKVKELAAGLEDVLEVVETGGVNLFLFEDQIPGALAEAEAAAAGLRKEIQALLGADQGAPELAFLNRDAIREAQDELAQAEALIGRIQARQEDFARRDAAAFASRTLAAVAQNEQLAQALRADLERLGIGEQLARVSDEQLATLTREGKLREFVLELQEKAARKTREQGDETDRAREKLAALRGELERRRSGELSVLDTLRDQAAAIAAQIPIVKRLADERERLGGSLAIAGAQRIGAGPDGATQDTGSLIESLNRAERERQSRPLLEARGIDPAVIEQAQQQQIEALRQLQDEFAVTRELSDQLAASLTLGLADGLTTLADAFGKAAASADGFQGFGNTALIALADLAGNVGKIAVGTGIAVAGIKKALESLNPVAAIVGGVALIGLAAAVKGRLSRMASGSSGNGANVIGGRVGGPAAGVSVPDTAQRAAPPSLQPLAPDAGTRAIPETIEWRVQGEDLVASVNNASKRQAQTRSGGIKIF